MHLVASNMYIASFFFFARNILLKLLPHMK